MSAEKPELVILPAHYTQYKIEPIYFIRENNLPFWMGNVIKYVTRAEMKDGVQDLKKARRYLDMEIARIEGHKDYASTQREPMLVVHDGEPYHGMMKPMDDHPRLPTAHERKAAEHTSACLCALCVLHRKELAHNG